MRPQAHTAAGLLVYAAAKDAPAWELPVDLVAAHLPDVDRNVAKALGVKRRDHHRWVSHSLVGWLPLTLVLMRHRAARRPLVALWSHLAMDTYADGLAWLWPVHQEKIGLFRQPPEIKDDGWNTPAPITTNLGRIEAAMWLGAALGLLRRP